MDTTSMKLMYLLLFWPLWNSLKVYMVSKWHVHRSVPEGFLYRFIDGKDHESANTHTHAPHTLRSAWLRLRIKYFNCMMAKILSLDHLKSRRLMSNNFPWMCGICLAVAYSDPFVCKSTKCLKRNMRQNGCRCWYEDGSDTRLQSTKDQLLIQNRSRCCKWPRAKKKEKKKINAKIKLNKNHNASLTKT